MVREDWDAEWTFIGSECVEEVKKYWLYLMFLRCNLLKSETHVDQKSNKAGS